MKDIDIISEFIQKLLPEMGFFITIFPFGDDELKAELRSNVSPDDMAKILEKLALVIKSKLNQN